MPKNNPSFNMSIKLLLETLGAVSYLEHPDVSYTYKPRFAPSTTMEDILLNEPFVQLLQQFMQENYRPCVLLQVATDPLAMSLTALNESVLKKRPAILKFNHDYFYVNQYERRINRIKPSTKWHTVLMQQARFFLDKPVDAEEHLIQAMNQVVTTSDLIDAVNPVPLVIDFNAVDIRHYYLSKDYIGHYCDQLAALKVPYEREYRIVLLTTIAVKFYLDQRDLNVGPPSLKVSLDEVQKNYNELVALDPAKTDVNLPHAGNKAVNYFLEDVRINCPAYHHKSLVETVSALSFTGKISKELQEYGALGRSSVTRWYGDAVPAKFNAYKVKQLCYKIQQEHQITVKHYLNLFGGWGYMLLGALATPSIERYIDTDPNELLYQPKQAMWTMLEPSKKVILYQLPMEDLTPEQLAPNNQLNELVFYSPPYFDMEGYQDQNNNQGRLVYNSYERWFDNILLKSVEVSYHSLTTPGILAIHIGSISSHGKVYETPIALQSYMRDKMSRFYQYGGELTYCPKTNIITRGASFIFIYKKLAYSEPFYLPVSERKSLREATLPELQQVVQALKQFAAVVAYYHVADTELLAAISTWDRRLSFNKLLNTTTKLPENAHVKLKDLRVDKRAMLLNLTVGELYNLVKEEENSFKRISIRLDIDIDHGYVWIKKLMRDWSEDSLRMDKWYHQTVGAFIAAGLPSASPIPKLHSACSATLFKAHSPLRAPCHTTGKLLPTDKALVSERSLSIYTEEKKPLSLKKALRLRADEHEQARDDNKPEFGIKRVCTVEIFERVDHSSYTESVGNSSYREAVLLDSIGMS